MNKSKAIGLGFVLALMFGLIYVTSESDRQIGEMAEKIESIPINTEYVSVAEQVSADADAILAEWEETKVNAAPYENIPLAEEEQIYLEERCKDYGIDFFLVIALMESESNFDTEAEGDSGNSYGLMQINSVWWETMSNRGIDVFTVRGNIDASLIILSEYLDKYQDETIAIQMYKCGEHRGRELLSMGITLSQAEMVIERKEQIKKETTHS